MGTQWYAKSTCNLGSLLSYAHHPDKRQAWVIPLPFLLTSDGQGDTAPTIQSRSDIDQFELPRLPETCQGSQEVAGRCRRQHLLHIMTAYQQLSLVGQWGAWGSRDGSTSDCAIPSYP